VTARIAEGSTPAEAHRLLEELEEKGPVAAPVDGPASRRLLILLAEQDPFAAEFTEYFLRTEGYADPALVRCHGRRSSSMPRPRPT